MNVRHPSHGAGSPGRNHDMSFRIGPRILAGTVFAGILLAGVGGWAATATLTGAVIAQGTVAVDQKLKAVQHRDGGIVSEIAVREGDVVRAGQVILRLEDAQTKAELSIVRSQMVELAARRARLLATRDGLSAIAFPPHLNPADPAVATVLQGETRLFAGNQRSRDSQKEQLELGIVQIGEEIRGLDAQRMAKEDEIALVEAEIQKLKTLLAKGLIEGSRVYSVDRERARLNGERGEIDAAMARAKTRIGEIRLQILAIDENARTEAQRELSLVETEFSERDDRRIAIEDRLARTDIRAPISGTVNELNTHTVGGVITPAEVLVTIVPENAKLKVETKLVPTAIDQVSAGQTARLRFTSFNQRTTPELMGTVVHVSPATTRDPGTGDFHYLADVEIGADELRKLGPVQLLPGMPVDVFVATGERTAMSYLVKPVTDQFNRAFRER